MILKRLAVPAVPALLAFLMLTGSCSASEAKRAAAQGAKLYDQGEYDGALPLLEKAAAKGLQDGELFYQLGYIYNLKGMPDKSRECREKAVPLLEKRAASKGATVESWYYLTALYANLGRTEDMRKSARQAVDKFGNASDLSGEDLFRMGRLYQFAQEGSKGAASYRRAVEAFSKEANPNATLYALALLADAQTDFQAHHFTEAARKFDEAARMSPRNAPSPYLTALAHLGAGDLKSASSDFGLVREGDLVTEAQYGADVARHLEQAGGAAAEPVEGKRLQEMDNPVLESEIKSAAGILRKARSEQESGKGSDEAVRAAERRFFSLVAEWMVRGNPIREPALSGGYADLIRR